MRMPRGAARPRSGAAHRTSGGDGVPRRGACRGRAALRADVYASGTPLPAGCGEGAVPRTGSASAGPVGHSGYRRDAVTTRTQRARPFRPGLDRRPRRVCVGNPGYRALRWGIVGTCSRGMAEPTRGRAHGLVSPSSVPMLQPTPSLRRWRRAVGCGVHSYGLHSHSLFMGTQITRQARGISRSSGEPWVPVREWRGTGTGHGRHHGGRSRVPGGEGAVPKRGKLGTVIPRWHHRSGETR
jgi:hypothetical protein